MPLFFQNGVLHCIFVLWCTIRIFYEGDEFKEQALPAHPKLFAQMLAGEVIILRIGIDAPGALFTEEIIQKA